MGGVHGERGFPQSRQDHSGGVGRVEPPVVGVLKCVIEGRVDVPIVGVLGGDSAQNKNLKKCRDENNV